MEMVKRHGICASLLIALCCGCSSVPGVVRAQNGALENAYAANPSGQPRSVETVGYHHNGYLMHTDHHPNLEHKLLQNTKGMIHHYANDTAHTWHAEPPRSACIGEGCPSCQTGQCDPRFHGQHGFRGRRGGSDWGHDYNCPPGGHGLGARGALPNNIYGHHGGHVQHYHTYDIKRPRNLVYPPANMPGGVITYPYYTHKGPDDFFKAD